MLWDTQGDDSDSAPLTLFNSGKPTGGDGIDDLIAFCIEVGQSVSTSFSSYVKREVAVAPNPYVSGAAAGVSIGVERAGLLDLLADNYWGNATGNGNILFPNCYTQAVNAAAFQLAVWEIVHESPSVDVTLETANPLYGQELNVSKDNGTFFVANSNPSLCSSVGMTIQLANNWLASLDTLVQNHGLSLFALTNVQKQDQIYQYEEFGLDTVRAAPEPCSFLIWTTITVAAIGRRSPTSKLLG